jgi:hypothetical protein
MTPSIPKRPAGNPPVAQNNPILYDISVNTGNSPGNLYSPAWYGFARRIVDIGGVHALEEIRHVIPLRSGQSLDKNLPEGCVKSDLRDFRLCRSRPVDWRISQRIYQDNKSGWFWQLVQSVPNQKLWFLTVL